MSSVKRRYPIGAEVIGENRTHFRLWAPKARQLDLVVERTAGSKRTLHPLTPEGDGYFSAIADIGAGTRYWFRVNSSEKF